MSVLEWIFVVVVKQKAIQMNDIWNTRYFRNNRGLANQSLKKLSRIHKIKIMHSKCR